MMRLLLVILIIVAAGAAFAWWTMVRMPGRTYSGAAPPFTGEETKLRDELVRDVQALAGEIGERNMSHYPQLLAAADYIDRAFVTAGFQPRRDSYEINGKSCDNIEVEIRGSSEIVVIGAHYDSVLGCPAANDNGSGVAALLAVARRFNGQATTRTLRFVAFPNEEQPHFLRREMGSLVYANRCKQKAENVVAMISLETIGYFSDAPGSQHYPLPGLNLFYPDRGNFIGFVGNVASRALVRETLGAFRQHATIPSEGAALPGAVPGVGWSDHWSFWQNGYPAVMVTDTAPFRYPHYHEPTDTPEKLDYDSMARVVSGLEHVVRALVMR
ncbi:MAG: M28 family peptidase [Chthoniobacterales bacterium]